MSKVIPLKQPVEIPDDLMKIGVFVKKYGCCRSYPYKLRDRGKLKLYRFGTYKLSESEALRVMGVYDSRWQA